VISVEGVPFLSALINAGTTAEAVRPQAEQVQKYYLTVTAEQIAASNRLAFASMMSDASRVEAATKWGATDGPAAGAMVAEIMTTDIRTDVARIKSPLLLIGAGKRVSASPEQMQQARQAYEAQVARVPVHEVVFAENALHFVMYDDLPFLLRTMDGFLNH
jgi:pimeloyl-ACP methyl ester carboxylesterase